MDEVTRLQFDVADRILKQPGAGLRVYADSTMPGTQVPWRQVMAHEHCIVLDFANPHGYGDFQINMWGLRETLRFNGTWILVAIPWAAIFGLQDRQGMADPMYFDCRMHPEMRVDGQDRRQWVPPELTKRKGHLGLVGDNDASEYQQSA